MRNPFIKYIFKINVKEESDAFISLFNENGVSENRLIFVIGDVDCITSHIIYHMNCNVEPISSFIPIISSCHNYFNYKPYSDIVTYSIKDLIQTIMKISKSDHLYRQLLYKRLKEIENYKGMIESTLTSISYEESSKFHISYFPYERYLTPLQLEVKNLFMKIMKEEVICKSKYFVLNINSIYLKPTFSMKKLISAIVDSNIINNNNDYIRIVYIYLFIFILLLIEI